MMLTLRQADFSGPLMPDDNSQDAQQLADFCTALIKNVEAQSAAPALAFQAGLAQFALFEKEPLVTQWATTQFNEIVYQTTASRIHLVYSELPDHSAIALLNDLWFSEVENLFEQAGLNGFYHPDRQHLEFYDPTQKVGLRILPRHADCPIWESSAPLANFVGWANAASGGNMLHAATLGTATKGALICGKGGSGKSLLTLAGVTIGIDSAGDDYVILKGSPEERYTAWQCSNTAKQSPQGLGLLGDSGEQFKDGPLNWQQKYVFQLPRKARDLPVSIDMIIVPRIADCPKINAAQRADVFRQLTESTIQQLAGRRRPLLTFCASLVRALPVFEFEMGPDIRANAHFLHEFLERQDWA